MDVAFVRVLAIAFALTAALVGQARADLNLGLLEFPNIHASFIDVTYDAGTNSFLASGFALGLDDDGVGAPEYILNSGGDPFTFGTFDITATINEFGVASSATLSIGGTVPTLGFGSGVLLTGTLNDFSFPDSGSPYDPFEFLFDVSGGDAAGLFGSGPAGVILNSNTGFGGSFLVDFDNLVGGVPSTGSSSADVAPVPVPSAVLLGAIGLSTVGWLRERRVSKRTGRALSAGL